MHAEDLEKQIADIVALNRQVKPADAERAMAVLLAGLSGGEATKYKDQLLRGINTFLPKRQRSLLRLLEDAEKNPNRPSSVRITVAPEAVGDSEKESRDAAQEIVREFRIRWRELLHDLSTHHIFQWEGYYPRVFSRIVQDAEGLVRQHARGSDVLNLCRHEAATHTHEIFAKGYSHLTVDQGRAADYAVSAARRGLPRLLDVVRRLLADDPSNDRRQVCSALWFGAFDGFGRVSYGGQSGWQVLSSDAEQWIEYAVLMGDSDLDQLGEKLPEGPTHRSVRRFIEPVAAAIERALQAESPVGIPVAAVFDSRVGRMEVHLSRLGGRGTVAQTIHCYISADFGEVRLLLESAHRDATLIVVDLPEDLRRQVYEEPMLAEPVVDLRYGSDETYDSCVNRISTRLQRRAQTQSGTSAGYSPLTYNYALDFPLRTPRIGHYRVQRPSVRNLLRNFERRNGAHVWCSVRRSGKTTACFALDSTTENSRVVAQTCASTDQYLDDSVLYSKIQEKLQTKSRIPRGFLEEIARPLIPGGGDARKLVLIIDEYENLFRELYYKSTIDPESRHNVALPLLNEFVSFSRNNLLIFVGQRPDAHHILMDQNQLSPYVEQDAFPLFTHSAGSASSEFAELMGKVLPEPFVLTGGFVDAVHRETGGHPYLTVSFLVDFVDWLIHISRPLRELEIFQEDYDVYASVRLTPQAIKVNERYGLLRDMAAEAMASGLPHGDPWLRAVYLALQRLCRESPETLAVTRGDFDRLVGIGEGNERSYDPDYLLQSASKANFFSFTGSAVRPGVPLLGRIVAATTPRVAF